MPDNQKSKIIVIETRNKSYSNYGKKTEYTMENSNNMDSMNIKIDTVKNNCNVVQGQTPA